MAESKLQGLSFAGAVKGEKTSPQPTFEAMQVDEAHFPPLALPPQTRGSYERRLRRVRSESLTNNSNFAKKSNAPTHRSGKFHGRAANVWAKSIRKMEVTTSPAGTGEKVSTRV